MEPFQLASFRSGHSGRIFEMCGKREVNTVVRANWGSMTGFPFLWMCSLQCCGEKESGRYQRFAVPESVPDW